MFQSVRDFLRRRDLRKHSSTVPTGIRPLAGIRKVAVFLPAAEADAPTLSLIRDALSGKELSIFVISPERKASPVSGAVLLTPSHMNILGRVSSSHKVPRTSVGEDLFISLFEEDPFAVEYAARCSSAAFKAGRNQLEGSIYDLVVMTPDGERGSCAEAFSEMVRMMQLVK